MVCKVTYPNLLLQAESDILLTCIEKNCTSVGGCLRQTTAQRKSDSEEDRLYTTPSNHLPTLTGNPKEVGSCSQGNTVIAQSTQVRYYLFMVSLYCSFLSAIFVWGSTSWIHFWNEGQLSHCLANYIQPQELSHFETGIGILKLKNYKLLQYFCMSHALKFGNLWENGA